AGMGAIRAGHHPDWLAGRTVANVGMLDRAAGLFVDAAGPVDWHEGLGRDQLSGLAVENVEEPVLVGLHEDLATLAADCEVSEDQLLDGVLVPLFTRRNLEMPNIVAAIGVERHDRGQKQVVALVGAATGPVPLQAVADAEIDEIELGVV